MKNSVIVLLALLTFGCSSPDSPAEREKARQKVNKVSNEVVNRISEHYVEVPEQMEYAYGYATVRMSEVQLPILGKSSGIGSIYNNTDGTVTYIDVDKYDLGAGLALHQYDGIAIFDTEEQLEAYKEGNWHLSFAANANLGGSGGRSKANILDGDFDVPVYLLDYSGASAGTSAQVMSTSINYDLTETGLGDRQTANKEVGKTTTAKNWDRALPFYAQNVIDKGYSLPKPFGVSVVYTDTYQYMDITGLNVGINGSKKYPIDFVSFHNSSNDTQSPQLKLDAWLFPFMNVFGSVGKISGTADLGIQFSGDDLVGQLGTDCSGRLKPFVCRLRGKDPLYNVTADLRGTNYTVGTILATGWHDYFFTVPMSATYADMRKNDAEGLIVNITPRIGKVFPVKGSQSIALYTGATYIDSTLTLTGTYTYEGVGIDYNVKQSNVDKWSGLVGANYTFNKDWSVSAEYGWVSDRKHQFVSTLNRRF